MRKLIALVVLLCGFMPVLWAADGCDQHLSREEFRAKQKAFIIEQAGLTKEEAAKFFPVYFELQDKKKKLNDESWDLMRKGKETYHTTAAQAAQLALDANVRQLVIGHFSARYEDESILLNEASGIFPQTILAKENLCIDVDGGTVYEK